MSDNARAMLREWLFQRLDENARDWMTGQLSRLETERGDASLGIAFGLAPSGPVTQPVTVTPVSGSGGQYLQVAFRRKSADTDIRYVIEHSADLVTWATLKTIDPGTPIDVLEQDDVPIGSVPRRFLRVRIEPKR